MSRAGRPQVRNSLPRKPQDKYCRVEKLVSRRVHNPKIAGPSPAPAPIHGKARVVHLALIMMRVKARSQDSTPHRAP